MAREEFRVYNSLTQQKEAFKTREPGKVGMYVCGVTAYDLSHLGHARAAVNFDVLYRYLQHLGYEVNYVRNFTDVDDKIIRRANEIGEDPLSLSNRFCDEYLQDMGDLQCLVPTHQPRVSDHMEQIKDMITQIIDKGFAYTVDGDVYYAVDKCPNYGQLSGQRLENNRAGERVAVDSRKLNPFDFALWKAAKPGEPSWDSPWGPGRPGWHIECSAMSATYLTFKFDIHGGGIDLIFPHHENEIAQSCAACEDSNIGYWMHNGHVTNNNEKMSKSLGNFFTIRQITGMYHPLALRYFLLNAHYRSPLNYTVAQLESASDAVFYIYQTLLDCDDSLSAFQKEISKEGSDQNCKTIQIDPADAQECITKLRTEFETKMSDDMNTAHILTGAFQDALKLINSSINAVKKKQPKKQKQQKQQQQQQQKQDQQDQEEQERQQKLLIIKSLGEVKQQIEDVLNILGVLSSSTYSEVLQQLKEKALKRAGLVEDDVANLIEARAEARRNKEFAKSDQIRADLTARGIALMDVGKETIWRPCVPIDQQPAVVEAPPVIQEQAST